MNKLKIKSTILLLVFLSLFNSPKATAQFNLGVVYYGATLQEINHFQDVIGHVGGYFLEPLRAHLNKAGFLYFAGNYNGYRDAKVELDKALTLIKDRIRILERLTNQDDFIAHAVSLLKIIQERFTTLHHLADMAQSSYIGGDLPNGGNPDDNVDGTIPST